MARGTSQIIFEKKKSEETGRIFCATFIVACYLTYFSLKPFLECSVVNKTCINYLQFNNTLYAKTYFPVYISAKMNSFFCYIL